MVIGVYVKQDVLNHLRVRNFHYLRKFTQILEGGHQIVPVRLSGRREAQNSEKNIYIVYGYPLSDFPSELKNHQRAPLVLDMVCQNVIQIMVLDSNQVPIEFSQFAELKKAKNVSFHLLTKKKLIMVVREIVQPMVVLGVPQLQMKTEKSCEVIGVIVNLDVHFVKKTKVKFQLV